MVKIGFHFQGIFCIAYIDSQEIKRVFVDDMELNLLPEMIPAIMKAYRKRQMVMN